MSPVVLSFSSIFISMYLPHYFCLSAFHCEDVHITGVGTHCKPVSFLAEGQAINVGEFVSSPDLLDHLSSPRIENSHLNTFFRGSYQLFSILTHFHCT